MEPQANCALFTYVMHTQSYIADSLHMRLPLASRLQLPHQDAMHTADCAVQNAECHITQSHVLHIRGEFAQVACCFAGC